ncbi:MAG: ACR3 family arsenite efflux transporter [Planctomycetes bacterium]|nr:ACR3 family arsenite efflux transporter [Planctomycetota bacterium]
MATTAPAAGQPLGQSPCHGAERAGGKLKVLFLCTGNSCRSQMAEAWARARCADTLEVWSAGTQPQGIDPRAARVMAEAGVPLEGGRSKHVNELAGIRFDHVITLCGHAQEHCPFFPGPTRVRHVGFDDPPRLAAGAPDEESALGHYRRVRDELRAFVERLPGMLREAPDAAPGNDSAVTPAVPAPPAVPAAAPAPGGMGLFERRLSLWVALCMFVGIALGRWLPDLTARLRVLEFGAGSQINIPIAILIWLMIYPMMLKIDFASVLEVRRRPRGLLVTLFVNWLVKPFSMALVGALFFRYVFASWIGPDLAGQYLAGVIILAAAPCTAMVFVWSQLSDGDPAYTLVQVAVNDLVMLFAFAPIVSLLVAGAAGLVVPFRVLLYAVLIFVVIPLALGAGSRTLLLRRRGREWFENRLLPRFRPVTVVALLATLVLIFAFQADNLISRPVHVLLIAVPILLQVYFNSGLALILMRLLRVPYRVAAPGALIGASNFFELAVATAITLYGPESGAALATVVGVLVEVPVMLSVCTGCRALRAGYERAVPAAGMTV